MKKVYIFCNSQYKHGNTYWLIAEDGRLFGTHFCSGAGFAYDDLYRRRPESHKEIENYMGGKLNEAFRIVQLPDGECPPITQEQVEQANN